MTPDGRCERSAPGRDVGVTTSKADASRLTDARGVRRCCRSFWQQSRIAALSASGHVVALRRKAEFRRTAHRHRDDLRPSSIRTISSRATAAPCAASTALTTPLISGATPPANARARSLPTAMCATWEPTRRVGMALTAYGCIEYLDRITMTSVGAMRQQRRAPVESGVSPVWCWHWGSRLRPNPWARRRAE
jgi:hypothetical protein